MTESPGASSRSAEDLLWPLPPMGGALGVVNAWHIPRPDRAREAALDVVRRQLAVWSVASVTVGAAVLLVAELLDGVVRAGARPWFLELNQGGGRVGIALREAVPSGEVPPMGGWERGLGALAEDLSVTRMPDGSGYAYTARLPAAPAGRESAARARESAPKDAPAGQPPDRSSGGRSQPRGANPRASHLHAH